MAIIQGAVIYAVISLWHGRLHKTNMEVLVSFQFYSVVVVCAWSTTQKMCWRLTSVGLAQAHPNKASGLGGRSFPVVRQAG